MWELGTRLAGDLGLSAIHPMNGQIEKTTINCGSERAREYGSPFN